MLGAAARWVARLLLSVALCGAGGVLAQGADAASAAAAAASVPGPPAQASAPLATPAAGRRAYTSYCARCHGLNLAVGSSAYFDLRRLRRDEKPRFLRSVRQGLRAMPAWEGIVKPEEMESIWLYIGSVNGWSD